MLRNCFVVCLCSLLSILAKGQYAPQAGMLGSTAIISNSTLFVGWATYCKVQRGYIDIANKALGYTTAGDSTNAVGPADNTTISLGDSGIATLTFLNPIFDGQGTDFAVFENGFRNPSDSTQAFLELAFVEVSSDGVNFFRFPSTSLTPDNIQIPGSGVYMDASKINNLAGKYLAGYGTPFDLDELAGKIGLNINHITHVRIVDVVGAINGHSSLDSAGRVINDPYPTDFPTGGFDLDAVGVINQINSGIREITNNVSVEVFPNPVTDNLNIVLHCSQIENFEAIISTVTGNEIERTLLITGSNNINLSNYPKGIYILTITNAIGEKCINKILKY